MSFVITDAEFALGFTIICLFCGLYLLRENDAIS